MRAWSVNKPDWLYAFPFLHRHWRDISTLQAKFNGLVQFDIASDWQQFIQQSQQQHASFDWFHLLRLYRHSRLAYLAYQDIALPLEQHVKTMHMVTALADHLIQVAHQVAAEAMQQNISNWCVSKIGSKPHNFDRAAGFYNQSYKQPQWGTCP